MLRRVADGEPLGRVDVRTLARPEVQLRRRTIRLAGVVVAFAALLELTAPATKLGFNLFTAEAALVASALLVLGDSLRKLALTD